ncbi:MAG TPA: hypothetical protein VK034_09600 [Enhygromyxa sp.]|nr:hypothetical protein [Enhygromyxa sp.]
MLSLTLLITSGCADSGTTTVDIQTEARATASHRPPSIAQRGPSSSPVETPRVSEADTDPEPASLEAEQTELRATITDLELELRLTAEAAEHMGEDFEQAMESIEAELEDRRMQLAIISGCPEDAETTDECPAFGA